MDPITSLEKLSQLRDSFTTKVSVSTERVWTALNVENGMESLVMHELTPLFFPEATERDKRVEEADSCLRHLCVTTNLLFPSLALECPYLKGITLEDAISKNGEKIFITPIKVWDEVNWQEWVKIVNPEYIFADYLAPGFLLLDGGIIRK